MYNNSAWHHRHFVISHSLQWTAATIAAEIDYTLEQAHAAPDNYSAWSYLLGCEPIMRPV